MNFILVNTLILSRKLAPLVVMCLAYHAPVLPTSAWTSAETPGSAPVPTPRRRATNAATDVVPQVLNFQKLATVLTFLHLSRYRRKSY